MSQSEDEEGWCTRDFEGAMVETVIAKDYSRQQKKKKVETFFRFRVRREMMQLWIIRDPSTV